MRMTITGAMVLSLSALATSAWAHTDEYFEAVQAPHGGQLRMTGPFHMELVAQDGQLMVHVTDHADNKISVEGGLAKATIETGPTKTQVHLHPVGDNMLKGSGSFSLTPSTVVIVFMKLPNQDGYAARFMPLKPKPDPTEKAHEDASKSGGDEHHHHHHSPKH
ncbi:MAG: hypothetical protein FJ247_01040 [Nitrospira sp.]|nr:hypothetical protein [Nitrospira sp.]